jgi:ribose transport system substrate-binding protein
VGPALIVGLAGCGSGNNQQGGPAIQYGNNPPNTTTAPNATGPATTGATDAGAATPAKFNKKTLKITMIAKSSTNPVFLSARKGAEDAAKELSAKTGVAISIDWQTPPQEDAQQQANNISQAVNSGSDAILISCSDAAKVTSAINDAVDRSVPVMTFDSDAPDSKRFAFYGADNHDVGIQVMEELAKLNHGKGNVAILDGNQNAPNLKIRADAVKEDAAKYPGIKIVGVFNHLETPDDATNEVEKDMKAYPQIDSWAMVGGWPLFSPALLHELDPAKVKVVAVDALPVELPYVEHGVAPVLLAQPTYLWGHKSVEILVDHIVNGKDVPAINKMDLVRVDKASLGKWAAQLTAWGFPDVDKYYPAK